MPGSHTALPHRLRVIRRDSSLDGRQFQVSWSGRLIQSAAFTSRGTEKSKRADAPQTLFSVYFPLISQHTEKGAAFVAGLERTGCCEAGRRNQPTVVPEAWHQRGGPMLFLFFSLTHRHPIVSLANPARIPRRAVSHIRGVDNDAACPLPCATVSTAAGRHA